MSLANHSLIEKIAIEAKDSIPAQQLSVEQWIEQYNVTLCKMIVDHSIEYLGDNISNDLAQQLRGHFGFNERQ